jgi:TPR repeat protein
MANGKKQDERNRAGSNVEAQGMRALRRLGLCLATIAGMASPAFAQQPVAGIALPAQEIERRNAAAGFFLPQASTLAVLRDECRGILKDAPPNAEQVALEWWQRNRSELDAVNGWLARYFSALQASNPTAAKAASGELIRSTTQGTLESVRAIFKRQLPDAPTCTRALRRYQVPQADLAVIARNPGYERFAEFPDTVARLQKEPENLPPERFRSYQVQLPHSFGLLASLDTAQGAMERKDWAAAAGAFGSMADRGDVRAALTAARLYHRGEPPVRDPARAYALYYQAYAMGSAAGLNQLGVLLRDGAGVPADAKLATAAFLAAAADHGCQRDTAAGVAGERLPASA